MPSYISVTELEEWSTTGFQSDANHDKSALYEEIIEAASECIDLACQRTFVSSDATYRRLGNDKTTLILGDVYEVVSVATADGTAVTGWTFAAGSITLPSGWRSDTIYVLAVKTGAAAVPPDIKIATRILCARFLTRRTSAGGSGQGFFLTPNDSDVMRILKPYKRVVMG